MTGRMLEANLGAVRSRIEAAARRSGRKPEEVRLVVVTKSAPPETLRLLASLDVADIAENRVQVLLEKKASLPDPGRFRWHMIGHLQTNKVGRLLPHVDLIHSLDSARLAARIDEVAGSLGRRIQALVEVNTSGEESKFGLDPTSVPDALDEILRATHLDVRGFMTMAPFSDDPERSRPHFRTLADLLERERSRVGATLLGPELSMGMTQDFEVAIEEGATIVRVGTAVFAPETDSQGS